MKELDSILTSIIERFRQLKGNDRLRGEFLANLRSLARFKQEPFDYQPSGTPNFPKLVQLVHAVCHPECGTERLIVDGGTQRCPKCGSTMLRVEGVCYQRVQIEAVRPVDAARHRSVADSAPIT